MIPLRAGPGFPPYIMPPSMPRPTRYGDDLEMHDPCPGCHGPAVWSYTRQEGELRLPVLVIACAACDRAGVA